MTKFMIIIIFLINHNRNDFLTLRAIIATEKVSVHKSRIYRVNYQKSMFDTRDQYNILARL